MIRFYSTAWCPDCHSARSVLEARGVHYQEIDIDADAGAAEVVASINGGMRSVPTIVFADGTTMTEPSRARLEAKLDSLGL